VCTTRKERAKESAQDLAEQARRKKVQHMVGRQARANPAIIYMKELVDIGYVGEVMSCHMSMIRSGVLRRTSDRTWLRDDSLGATTLTISPLAIWGHTPTGASSARWSRQWKTRSAS
jgi:hypothetical protein